VFQRQGFDQIAGAGRARPFQQRKQVALLVVVMLHRGGVEVSQYRTRGLLRLRVGAVRRQMRQYFFQGVALFGDAAWQASSTSSGRSNPGAAAPSRLPVMDCASAATARSAGACRSNP